MSKAEAVLVALVVAPLPLCLMVAVLRGYSITIHLRREPKR